MASECKSEGLGLDFSCDTEMVYSILPYILPFYEKIVFTVITNPPILQLLKYTSNVFIPQFLQQFLMMNKNHQGYNLRMMITKVTTLLMLKHLLVVPMTLLVTGQIYKLKMVSELSVTGYNTPTEFSL